MIKIKEYVKAASLEEAYELNQKRSNRILGGMLWMRMSNAQVQTAIDLSGLGLDHIEETEEEFIIGAMVTLRELELNERLNDCFDHVLADAVKDIVGVQFRNLATVGGSVFGRFGFSDVLTVLLSLHASVELYKGGIVPPEEFAAMKRDNDILVNIRIAKTVGQYAYLTHRNTKTDFPVLAVAVSKIGEELRVAVGARPAKAELLDVKDLSGEKLNALNEALAKKLAERVKTDSNMRASAQYRSHLANVLIGRCFEKINACKKEGE